MEVVKKKAHKINGIQIYFINRINIHIIKYNNHSSLNSLRKVFF